MSFLKIIEYYDKKITEGFSKFICMLYIQCFLLTSLITIILLVLPVEKNRDSITFLSYQSAFAISLTPLLETFLFQFIPIELSKQFNMRRINQFYLCSSIFFLAHLGVSLRSGLVAGLGYGFFLNITYLSWREESKFKAFVATSLLHFLINLSIFLIVGVDSIYN